MVGTPSESNAQPAGISGCPLRNALKTLPAATVVVAISSSHGPGTDMQIGLVPSWPFLPCHGGTIGEALHITMPIWPAARIFCAHHAAAPKWFDSLATTSASPCCLRDPHGVPAAGLRHPLAQPVLPVEMQAAAAFRNHPAVGLRVHLTGQQLIDVERQQLNAVGIDAAQVGGNQAGGRDLRLVAGHSGPLQNGFAEMRQFGNRYGGHVILVFPVLHLARDQECQLHRLLVVQARIDFALVRARQVGLARTAASRPGTP